MEDLRRLNHFIEIAKCGSFAAAAKRLGVTPPAISKSIGQLERSLGARLFNRTTRRLHLTGEGQMLFNRLDSLLSGVDQAIDAVRESAEQPRGKIRVSVGATFGRYCLMPALVEFLEHYPLVEVEVSFDDTPSGFIEKGFDVGIHVGQGSETSLISRVLCPYPLILAASPQYLAKRGVPKNPDDLVHHDFVGVLARGSAVAEIGLEPVGRRTSQAAKPRRISVAPTCRLSIATQWDTNVSAALHGAGIVQTSLPAVMQFLQQGRLKVVLPGYRLASNMLRGDEIHVIYPHRQYLTAKVRVFVDFLLERFRTERESRIDLREFAA